MKEKIIIDTDPGIDDAMAIFLAFQLEQLEVLGLTTVFGNVPVEMSTRNAIILTDLAGQNIPVCQGAAKPLSGKQPAFAHFVHGDNGLGNVPLSEPSRSADTRSAAEFICEMARKYPGEVTLVPIGPLTNVAEAIKLDPELPKLLKKVVIMGGAARVRGNVSPVAEANIWNDPHAAADTFAAHYANPLVMMGLDVTYEVSFNAEFGEQLAKNNPVLGGFIQKVAEFYSKFYSEVFQHNPEPICYFHDAMAIAQITHPQLFSYQAGHMRVATDELCYGQTAFEQDDNPSKHELWKNEPLIDVAMEVQGDALRKLFLETYQQP